MKIQRVIMAVLSVILAVFGLNDSRLMGWFSGLQPWKMTIISLVLFVIIVALLLLITRQ